MTRMITRPQDHKTARLNKSGSHATMLSICLCIISFFLFLSPVSAQDVLTKGDAISLISATDFIKNKIGDLFSWTIGYDINKVNRIKLVPNIRYIKAVPRRIPPDGKSILEISAAVEDPSGLPNIAGVRADLSTVGRLSNMILVDNGLWGDKISGDGTYTIQSNINSNVSFGNKEIPVAVANKQGWLALAKTTITVDTSPQIIDSKIEPQTVRADAQTAMKISATVENPGRQEDLKEVYANLKEIGQGEKVALEYKGGQLFSVETVIPSIVSSGKKNISIYAVSVKNEISKVDLSVEVIK